MPTDNEINDRQAIPDRECWIEITGQAAGTSRYAWSLTDDTNAGVFGTSTLSTDFSTSGTSGATGWPAYEIQGHVDVPVGAKVKARFGGAGDFLVFRYDGPLVVEELDGSPSVAAVTTLQFDQADGFVVSEPSAHVAKIKLTAPAATLTHGMEELSGNYSISASNTWEDTGLFLNNLAIGSYQFTYTADVTAQVASWDALSLSQFVSCRLYDVTDASIVPLSTFQILTMHQPPASTDVHRMVVGISCQHDVTNSNTDIRLEALKSSPGSGSWAAAQVNDGSTIGWTKIG